MAWQAKRRHLAPFDPLLRGYGVHLGSLIER